MTTGVLRPLDDRFVTEIVRMHLDQETGSPFWVQRDRRLAMSAHANIRGFEDARRLLAFRDDEDQARFEEATRRRPVEDFLPAIVRDERDRVWVSQTGGTTGLPKHGTWAGRYWDDTLAFSDEMLDLHGVPYGENWMFIGPMGPHTTGRLVVAIAERRGGSCFSIDLDPRIVKIFGEEGMTDAYERYVQHIWDQVAAVIESQRFGVLFCTSRLLEMLPSRIDVEPLRERLRAIVHAGTTMTPESNELLRTAVFPGIPVAGMYGTSTTAISYQKPFEVADNYRVTYVPSSPHVVLEVTDESGESVPYGTEGRVRVWRFSQDQLLPGFAERDRAVRVKPYGTAAASYPWDWIGDPYSPEFAELGRVEGVY
ncbi:MAG: AMP-binding protein [Solirubrobacteraceae bacterium]